jgi:hypothetical protein
MQPRCRERLCEHLEHLKRVRTTRAFPDVGTFYGRLEGSPAKNKEEKVEKVVVVVQADKESFAVLRGHAPSPSSRRGLCMVLAKDVPFGGCSGVGCRLSWRRGWGAPCALIGFSPVPPYRPRQFSHRIRRGLSFGAVLCPMRLPTGHGGQSLGLRLCVHNES